MRPGGAAPMRKTQACVDGAAQQARALYGSAAMRASKLGWLGGYGEQDSWHRFFAAAPVVGFEVASFADVSLFRVGAAVRLRLQWPSDEPVGGGAEWELIRKSGESE